MRIKNPLDDIFGNRNNVRILRHMTLYPRRRPPAPPLPAPPLPAPARARPPAPPLPAPAPEITGRGLAKESGHEPCDLHPVPERPGRYRIIRRRTIGKSNVYELPVDSAVYASMLLPAFEAEKNLLNGLLEMLMKDIKGKVRAAYLFGSVARGEDTAESDIDILLILLPGTAQSQAERALEANSKKAYRMFRAGINVVIYEDDEFQRMKARGTP